jgi:hypothetical protein
MRILRENMLMILPKVVAFGVNRDDKCGFCHKTCLMETVGAK